MVVDNGNVGGAAAGDPGYGEAVQKHVVCVRPEEYDIVHLVVEFLLLSHRRQQSLSFGAFKSGWSASYLSHIFTVQLPRGDYEQFVESLFDIVLNFMTSGLPTEIIKAIVEAVNDANAMETPTLLVAQLEPAQPVWITPDEEAWLCRLSGPDLSCMGIYCLYCLYHAQPGNPIVKIRLARELQTMILEAASRMGHSSSSTHISPPDAAFLLRKLLDEHAMVPAAFSHPAAAPGMEGTDKESTLAPGVGVMLITPGLGGEDAAALREVRFHLDSTLTGLGTGHLDELCMQYRQQMIQLWDGLLGRAEYETSLQGVADLTLGRELHAFVINKGKEVNLVVQRGNCGFRLAREKKTDAGLRTKGRSKRKRREAAMMMPANGFETQQRPTATCTAVTQKPASSIGVEAADDVKGVPPVMRQLLRRKVARREDIERRARPWAERMGVEMSIALPVAGSLVPLSAAYSPENSEDMPLIPGMVSEFAHLAGPSAARTTSVATDTTVQGFRRGEDNHCPAQLPEADALDEEAEGVPDLFVPRRSRETITPSELLAAATSASLINTLALQALAEDGDYDGAIIDRRSDRDLIHKREPPEGRLRTTKALQTNPPRHEQTPGDITWK